MISSHWLKEKKTDFQSTHGLNLPEDDSRRSLFSNSYQRTALLLPLTKMQQQQQQQWSYSTKLTLQATSAMHVSIWNRKCLKEGQRCPFIKSLNNNKHEKRKLAEGSLQWSDQNYGVVFFFKKKYSCSRHAFANHLHLIEMKEFFSTEARRKLSWTVQRLSWSKLRKFGLKKKRYLQDKTFSGLLIIGDANGQGFKRLSLQDIFRKRL